jgi:hypothetical protein
MSERRFNLRRALLRAAQIYAWVFAVGTLGALVWIGWMHWPGTGSACHLMWVRIDGQPYGALGFHYKGVAGLVLIITEAVVLLSAIVMSVVPRRRLRGIGHVLLVIWAGLWLGNAVGITRLGGGPIFILWIGLLGLAFLCTAVRAGHGWWVGVSPRKAAEADVPA